MIQKQQPIHCPTPPAPTAPPVPPAFPAPPAPPTSKLLQHTCLPAILMLLLFVLGLASQAQAYPKPAMLSPAWKLQFTYETPRTFSLVETDGQTHWYWYMPYKVVNRTAKEQFFLPAIQIASNLGQVSTSGKGISPQVFTAIKKHLRNPLLINPLQVSGKILIGQDHAQESVIIWPTFLGDVDTMNIFIAGLSGETIAIQHPTTAKTISLRKTLMLTYLTPGSPNDYTTARRQAIKLKKQQWVMR